MRVVDSHLHLIDLRHDWYPGLKVWSESLNKPEIHRSFTVADHRAAAGKVHVDAFVHVSATTTPGAHLAEAAWVDDVAAAHELDLVTVGTVDPAGGAAQIRAELEQQAASARFRGVRVLYDFEPGSAAAGTVLSWLDERGLVLDLVATPETMTDWLRALEPFADLQVVLEHTGWPGGLDQDARQRWHQSIGEFARSTSAPCKLSGLGMVTLDLSEAALRPWLEPAIEALGWERVMFGSNMPIDLMGGTFARLLETLDAVVSQAEPADQARFWGENAAAAYRL